jgi:hypothetical protein
LSESQQSFEDVASYSPATLTLSGDADAEVIEGERVSASYFRVLRVRAILGRVFADAEDDAVAPAPVVVLSHDLWSRRWSADSSIIGKTVRVNGVTTLVIGVLPREFAGLSGRADVWFPRTISSQVTYAEYLTTNQNFISAVGRLRRGIGIDAARSELAFLGADINRAIPSDPDYPQERVTATAIPLNTARVDGAVRRSLLILVGGVALLHVLACANVINLLLGWAATRRREFAVRIALGTSAHRLFARTLGEGALLAVLGGLSGVALAWWTSRVIVPPANVWAPRNFYGSLAPFDAPSFGFAEVFFGIALTVATALLVAVLPALSVFRRTYCPGSGRGLRGAGDCPGGPSSIGRVWRGHASDRSVGPGAMPWAEPDGRWRNVSLGCDRYARWGPSEASLRRAVVAAEAAPTAASWLPRGFRPPPRRTPCAAPLWRTFRGQAPLRRARRADSARNDYNGRADAA